jgi:predicted lipoprotein with Yx(FWY)xxD motif
MRKIHLIFAAILVVSAIAVAGCGGGGGAYGSGSESSGSGAYGSGGGESTTAGAYGNSSSGGRYGSSSSTTSSSTAAGAAIVSVGSEPTLGRILVNSKGFTLYDFRKDQGTKSACFGACAKIWPPLTTEGAPKPSNGAAASKLGTTERTDGTTQVTYAGHPLYTYSADIEPGDANGNGLSTYGGQWFALTPQGAEPGS